MVEVSELLYILQVWVSIGAVSSIILFVLTRFTSLTDRAPWTVRDFVGLVIFGPLCGPATGVIALIAVMTWLYRVILWVWKRDFWDRLI